MIHLRPDDSARRAAEPRDGRARPAAPERPGGGASDIAAGRAPAGERLSAGELGTERLGERATLVHFSTAFCQPCRATRRVLSDVSALVPGVRHIEVDAESRLDLVRRLEITGTPTVLVLDPEGAVVKRASGLPRKHEVLAALALAVPEPGA